MRLGLVPDLLKGVGLALCLQLVPGERREEKIREGLNSTSPISSQLLIPAGYDRYCRIPLTIYYHRQKLIHGRAQITGR